MDRTQAGAMNDEGPPAPNDPGARFKRMIGLRIRRARMEKGLTLDETAAAAGVSAARLSAIEDGQSKVEPGELWDISQATGRTISYFFEVVAAPKN